MSSKDKSLGKVLINPANYSSRLSELEVGQDSAEISRIEDHLAHRLRLGGAITYLDEDGNHVIETRDGVKPFQDGDQFPSPPPSAELEIRELAFLHGVHTDRSELDQWCEAVTANAGDDIQSDEVEQLVIGLGRIETVDGPLLTQLHARYLEEMLNP